MMDNVRTKLFVAATVGMSVLGMAGTAFADDPLTGTGGAIDTVESQIVGYAAPIAAALVAIGLAFIAVKLIPKVIKWVGSRL